MIARDSTVASSIPQDGLDSVWGYADGFYEWTSADWALFPPTIIPLSIATNPASAADILDIETGDALPADAPSWRDRFNRPWRRRPTMYCNRESWIPVYSYVGNTVDYIIATLNGSTYIAPQYIPNGVTTLVAIQYKGSAQTGGNYDESIIIDPSWLTRQEDNMDLTITQRVEPFERIAVPGLFQGPVSINGVNYNRSIWVSAFSDSLDGTNIVPVVITAVNKDGAFWQQTLSITPSVYPGGIKVAGPAGPVAVSIENEGQQPITVAVTMTDG